MGQKEKIRDYFHFSRRDRIGIGVLLGLIGGVFFLPAALPLKAPGLPPVADSFWAARQQKQAETEKDPEIHSQGNGSWAETASPAKKPVFFFFDPNTLPADGWIQMGLRPKTAQIIRNYVSKGGKFREPADLKKIYGLPSPLAEQLIPWVKIPTATKSPEPAYSETKPQQTFSHEKKFDPVDINEADTSALIALPGIGSKLATRIVSFREKLGGFYGVEQVGEVYGLADSVFQKIRPLLKLSSPTFKKIRINSVTMEELKTHPYFRYELAKTIIAYRNAHGAFKSPEDLKQVMLITEEVFRKIRPYLSCE